MMKQAAMNGEEVELHRRNQISKFSLLRFFRFLSNNIFFSYTFLFNFDVRLCGKMESFLEKGILVIYTSMK